jgi:hypothetical protein
MPPADRPANSGSCLILDEIFTEIPLIAQSIVESAAID